MQLDIHFNTTNLSGSELKRREIKAGTQNAIVLAFFQRHPDGEFTPFDVQMYCLSMTPITSVRRSMTTLTDLGYLVKTSNRRPGIYGELNYTWKII